MTIAGFVKFDDNLCWRSGGTVTYSKAFATLAQAQAAGFDLHGSVADPLFATVAYGRERLFFVGAIRITRSPPWAPRRSTRCPPRRRWG